jgi:hypothetical protein
MMMQRILLACLLGVTTLSAWAISPYIPGDRVHPGKLATVAAEVEKKLTTEGFQVLGLYTPKYLPTHGVVVATDAGLLDKIRSFGGSTIVAAPIRVGITTDGAVAYANPDYWGRAFLGERFIQAEPAVHSIQSRLAKALGAGPGFGGNESATDLPEYRYMMGMESFDDEKNLLATHPDFESAVRTVQENLAKGRSSVSKAYELVLPESKVAVFGVAMNSRDISDTLIIGKIGVQDRIAGFPYEMFVVNDKVYALYGRYRLALAFPDLSMGSFIRIVYAPEDIHAMLKAVAGGN